MCWTEKVREKKEEKLVLKKKKRKKKRTLCPKGENAISLMKNLKPLSFLLFGSEDDDAKTA